MAIETERKYLCRMPDVSALSRLPGFTESRITQIYLAVGEENTHRVRARECGGTTVFTETVKKRVSPISCIEDERTIDGETFRALSEKRDPALRTIEKTRLTFLFGGQLFEVDIYPFYKTVCVVETELKDERESAVFPPELSVIRELSGDFRFSNAALAKEIPSEASLLG